MNNIEKDLNNIPYILGLNMTTIDCVAKYYKVEPHMIRNILNRNAKLKTILIDYLPYNTIKKHVLLHGEMDTTTKGIPKVKTTTGEFISVSYNTTALLSKEAILQIAKFLPSEKAQLIAQEIDRDKNLHIKDQIKKAFINNDIEAFNKLVPQIHIVMNNTLQAQNKDKHIKQLNCEILDLTNQLNTTIEVDMYRKNIIKTLHRISNQKNKKTAQEIQQRLFNQLKTIFGIDLIGRKYALKNNNHKYAIDTLQTIKEWRIATNLLNSICKDIKVDVSDILN